MKFEFLNVRSVQVSTQPPGHCAKVVYSDSKPLAYISMLPKVIFCGSGRYPGTDTPDRDTMEPPFYDPLENKDKT